MKKKPPELPGMEGPMKWAEFEAAVKERGYHLYWRRYESLPDTLKISGMDRHPDYPGIDVAPALDFSVHCQSDNLAESKREAAQKGREVLTQLATAEKRLSRVLPVAALFANPDAPHYERREITIYPSAIHVRAHYKTEVRITDDLEVEVRMDYTDHTATIGSLEETITELKGIRNVYEKMLDPVQLYGGTEGAAPCSP